MPAKLAAVVTALLIGANGETTPSARWRASRQRLLALGKLTKPNLTLMNVLTTLLGLHLGTSGGWSWSLLLATLGGTALCAGGACGLNMVLERDADALMRRTRTRPIPAGEVSAPAATFFSLSLIASGAFWLASEANLLTMAIALFAAAVYVFLYTPLKRITPWATWVGAIPGALPPVIGFAAARGALDLQALCVFAILFFWQLPHFYALALIYRDDYTRGGFKVQPQNATAFNVAALERQVAFGTVALSIATLSIYAGHFAGKIYLAGAITAAALVAWRATQLLRTHTTPAARHLFFATLIYLPVLVAALLLDNPHALLQLF